MIVTEQICTGPIARWFHRRGWGAATLPSWRGIKIRYWLAKNPEVARHEWSLHVPQIRRLGKFGYLKTYVRLWIYGYRFARRGGFGLSRKEAASFAYNAHPMESDD